MLITIDSVKSLLQATVWRPADTTILTELTTAEQEELRPPVTWGTSEMLSQDKVGLFLDILGWTPQILHYI